MNSRFSTELGAVRTGDFKHVRKMTVLREVPTIPFSHRSSRLRVSGHNGPNKRTAQINRGGISGYIQFGTE